MGEVANSTPKTWLICFEALAAKECPDHKMFIEGD